MIDKATNQVSRLVHNPWSMLMAWVAVIGLMAGGMTAFYSVDKRVVQNSERYHALATQAVERARVVDRQLDRIRQDADEDRRQIRNALDQMNGKLDELNRYLRDNPRGE